MDRHRQCILLFAPAPEPPDFARRAEPTLRFLHPGQFRITRDWVARDRLARRYESKQCRTPQTELLSCPTVPVHWLRAHVQPPHWAGRWPALVPPGARVPPLREPQLPPGWPARAPHEKWLVP